MALCDVLQAAGAALMCSQTHWLHHFLWVPGFSPKPTQSLIVDVEVGLRIEVGWGGDGGWGTPLRKTGTGGIITRGDSLPSPHMRRQWEAGSGM